MTTCSLFTFAFTTKIDVFLRFCRSKNKHISRNEIQKQKKKRVVGGLERVLGTSAVNASWIAASFF